MKLKFGHILAFATLMALVRSADAMEHVVVRRDGQTLHVSGRLITDAQDGGLLILGRDGALWAIQPDEIVEHQSDDVPFQALDQEELTSKVLGELPDGFEVYTTANYIIIHNTSKVYAQWCGALFERLHRGFTNFWEQRRMPIRKPEVPLVALVFKDEESLPDAKGEDIKALAKPFTTARFNVIGMLPAWGIEDFMADRLRQDKGEDVRYIGVKKKQ